VKILKKHIIKVLKILGVILGVVLGSVILGIFEKYAQKIFIGILFLASILITESFEDNLSKTEIFDMVNANYSIILNNIESNDFNSILQIKGIENVTEETENVILFDCGGEGFASETTDYGFYYTDDDLPYNFVNIFTNHVKEDLVNEGDGYVARQKDGDDYYYTEKIRNKFYYYEVHY
jgi:hypothetical protein